MKAQIFLLLVLFSSTLSLRRRSFLKKINRHKDLYQRSHRDATEIVPHSLAYHALLYENNNFYSCYCSGALISLRFVVTYYMCEERMAKPMVVLGIHKISDISNPNRNNPQIFTDNLYVMPPEARHVIVLIKLSRKAERTEYVSPIPIAPANTPEYSGSNLVISGWLDGGKYFSELNEHSALLSDIVVQRPSAGCEYLTQYEICYEVRGSKRVDDSGSPITHKNTGLLVGVHGISWHPLFYAAKISYYAEWIFGKIVEDSA